jgi:hypothetical protein
MGCHPECRWLCDDPLCLAVCKPIFEQPVCSCANPGVNPVCRVLCAQDQCEMDSCPQCEVQCDPNPNCGAITCEQLVSSWSCRKPSDCALPTCELQCELPFCPYEGPLDPWKEEEKLSPSIILIACIILIGFMGWLRK